MGFLYLEYISGRSLFLALSQSQAKAGGVRFKPGQYITIYISSWLIEYSLQRHHF